jgi:hypothetical protein
LPEEIEMSPQNSVVAVNRTHSEADQSFLPRI